MTTPIKVSRHAILSLCASSALLMVAGGVIQIAAAADGPVLTKNVAYGDLDLNSEKGARALLARLRLAAGEVCEPLASRDLGMRAHWQACFNHAVSEAVDKINSHALTALYIHTNRQPHG